MNTATQIKITGYLVGYIWMPCGECWKDLEYDLSGEQRRFIEPGTLRDHVLRATNDGDFQSCSIAQGEIVVTRTSRSGGTTIRRTRSFPMSMFPSVSDLIHDDPDWFPCFNDEEAA
jgi:hypothetical protein